MAVIEEYRSDLESVLDTLSPGDVLGLIRLLEEAHKSRRQIFVIGNGGSAATASHLACDLAKTVLSSQQAADLKRFRVTALTDNMPLITAYGNDVGYESTFAEPLRNLATENDLLIVISGSGNSPNVIEALTAARALGLKTVGLLGFDGGQARKLADHSVVVDSEYYGHIEDVHMILVHLVTRYFQESFKHLPAKAGTPGQSGGGASTP